MGYSFGLVNILAEQRGLSLSQAVAPYARLCARLYCTDLRLSVDNRLYRLNLVTPYHSHVQERQISVSQETALNFSELQSTFHSLFDPEFSREGVEEKYAPEGTVIYGPSGNGPKKLDAATAYFLNADWYDIPLRFPPPLREWFREYRWVFRAEYNSVRYGERPKNNKATTVNLVLPDGGQMTGDLMDKEQP